MVSRGTVLASVGDEEAQHNPWRRGHACGFIDDTLVIDPKERANRRDIAIAHKIFREATGVKAWESRRLYIALRERFGPEVRSTCGRFFLGNQNQARTRTTGQLAQR